MNPLTEFYTLHPLWTWMSVAAVILAVEIITSTGWMLWPAACAAVVGIVAGVTRALGLPGEIALFAVLAVVSSLTVRKYLRPKDMQPGEDINDRAHTLTGKIGQVTQVDGGRLRVLVDGAEWEAESNQSLAAGQQVKVQRVLGGARLAVEPV